MKVSAPPFDFTDRITVTVEDAAVMAPVPWIETGYLVLVSRHAGGAVLSNRARVRGDELDRHRERQLRLQPRDHPGVVARALDPVRRLPVPVVSANRGRDLGGREAPKGGVRRVAPREPGCALHDRTPARAIASSDIVMGNSMLFGMV